MVYLCQMTYSKTLDGQMKCSVPLIIMHFKQWLSFIFLKLLQEFTNNHSVSTLTGKVERGLVLSIAEDVEATTDI